MEAPENLWIDDWSDYAPHIVDNKDLCVEGAPYVEYVRADRRLPPELTERIRQALAAWSWADGPSATRELLTDVLEEVKSP